MPLSSINSIRITPTCVWKSKNSIESLKLIRDHPHVCGEKRTYEFHHSHQLGSPPRVWGKEAPTIEIPALTRITPTCVGKSAGTKRKNTTTQDHPHVCGEKLRSLATSPHEKGSPPRVWGKAQKMSIVKGFLGITPTCVGKRVLAASKQVLDRDHPHVCGEKKYQPHATHGRGGSPPRVWGKV